MADLNLLPREYRLQQRAKRRKRSCLVVFFILFVLLAGHILSLAGRIQWYRRELADLQQQLAGLEEELVVLEEWEEKGRIIEKRQQLSSQLERENLPWSLLLGDLEGAARPGILFEQLHIDREGKITLLGEAGELASIAAFLSSLAASPRLATLDLDYVRQGKEGQWLFALEGRVKQVGEGL